MNLTRQMQSIADLYNQVKPIQEKSNTLVPTSKNLYSSTSDKNSGMLNEMYLNILNKSTKQEVLSEAKIQPGVDTKKADINKNKKLEDWEVARANKAFGQEDNEETNKKPGAKLLHTKKPGKVHPKSYGDQEAEKHKTDKMYQTKYRNNKRKAKSKLLASEKFEQFGKTKHLMSGLNYKTPASKGFKPPGSGKNTAVKKAVGKVASQSFLKATENPKTPAFIKNSGPDTDGAKPLLTPIEPGAKNKENYYNVNKFSQGTKKINEKRINNDMNKSIFDKLYEDVMADDDALALGATDAALDDADMGADMGDEMGGDEVTLTLPRDVAQQLHSMLSDILGAEGDLGADEDLGDEEGLDDLGAEGDLGEEDEQAIGDDEPMGEKIEAEELGHPLVNQKKGLQLTDTKGKGNVVDSTVSKLGKAGKGGDGKVTDKVGNDGDEGHPLVNMKKGTELSNVKGKANVVKSTTSSKVGDTFFQPA